MIAVQLHALSISSYFIVFHLFFPHAPPTPSTLRHAFSISKVIYWHIVVLNTEVGKSEHHFHADILISDFFFFSLFQFHC